MITIDTARLDDRDRLLLRLALRAGHEVIEGLGCPIRILSTRQVLCRDGVALDGFDHVGDVVLSTGGFTLATISSESFDGTVAEYRAREGHR